MVLQARRARPFSPAGMGLFSYTQLALLELLPFIT